MKRIAGAVVFIFLSGCATQVTERVRLVPAGNECQVTEVRSSMLATSVLRVCWDESRKPIIATSGDGLPSAAVVTGIATAGAIVGAGVAVGSGMSKIKTSTAVTIPGTE